MGSLKIILRKTESDKFKTGEYPIKLQIIHNRKVRFFDLNLKCFKEQFISLETGLGQVDSTVQNYKDKNIFLTNKLKLADAAVIKLLDRSIPFTVDDIIKELSDIARQSFIEYAKKLEKQLRKDGKIGTANSYLAAYRLFERHLGHSNLYFDEINVKFLKTIETKYLNAHPDGVNGLSAYLRAVRTIFNTARNVDKIIPKNCYPFDEYKIKQKKTRKRAIKKLAIENIVNLNLEPKDPIYHSWNYFIFMFYCRGINFSDLARLTYKKNVREGRIMYTRQKLSAEGKEITIKITDQIQEILNRYPKKGKYIFPIITYEDTEDVYFEVKSKLKTMNDHLEKIANLAGVNARLTTNVARHSWASIANSMGVPLSAIQQGLSHTDIATTQIYVEGFNLDEMDDYNDLVTGKTKEDPKSPN